MAEAGILSGFAGDREAGWAFAAVLPAIVPNSEFRHSIRFPIHRPVCSRPAEVLDMIKYHSKRPLKVYKTVT